MSSRCISDGSHLESTLLRGELPTPHFYRDLTEEATAGRSGGPGSSPSDDRRNRPGDAAELLRSPIRTASETPVLFGSPASRDHSACSLPTPIDILAGCPDLRTSIRSAFGVVETFGWIERRPRRLACTGVRGDLRFCGAPPSRRPTSFGVVSRRLWARTSEFSPDPECPFVRLARSRRASQSMPTRASRCRKWARSVSLRLTGSSR